jgi:hypothetical protein
MQTCGPLKEIEHGPKINPNSYKSFLWGVQVFQTRHLITSNPAFICLGELNMHCLWCGSSKLKISPLQVSDIARLFLMQRPVRCRFCNERYHASIFSAWKLTASEKARSAERRRSESNAA